MMMCFVIDLCENTPPPLSAPESLAILQSESPERVGITEELRGIGCWNCDDWLLIKCVLREIRIML